MLKIDSLQGRADSLVAAAKVNSRIGLGALAAAWQGLFNCVFDPYRPECHYMRGPGPKWRLRKNLRDLSDH